MVLIIAVLVENSIVLSGKRLLMIGRVALVLVVVVLVGESIVLSEQ